MGKTVARLNVLHGNCLERMRDLADSSIDCCVTSPPYWGLRDYGIPKSRWPEVEFSPMSGTPSVLVPAMKCCLGLEPNPTSFIGHIVQVFREVWRVLREDGTCWINFGDSYVANGGHSDEHCNDRRGQSGFACRPEHEKREFRIGAGAGLNPKNLIGVSWRVAFALQADGWYLRSDIIWHKPNPMPESVNDRPTKAHEYLFLLSKTEHYHYDADAIKEAVTGGAHPRGNGCNPKAARIPSGWDTSGGSHHNLIGRYKKPGRNSRVHVDRDVQHASRAIKQNRSFSEAVCGLVSTRNKRSVWTVPTYSFKGAHFATFPPDLVKPCIMAGCPKGGVVLDPFAGTGTTGAVALELGGSAVLIEIGKQYLPMIDERTNVTVGFGI